MVDCSICGRTFKSPAGLKIHSGSCEQVQCRIIGCTAPGNKQNRHLCIKHRATDKNMRKYGLYVEDFYFLLEQQNYKCKICIRDFDLSGGIYAKLRPQLDHCHETAVPRGLLCVECNIGLGMFKDSPKNLEAALSYLRLEPHTPVSVSKSMSDIRGGKMPKHENYDFTKRREASGVSIEDTLGCPHCSEIGFISQAGVNRHIGRMHKEIRLPGSRRK